MVRNQIHLKSVIKDQVKQFDAHNYQTDNQQVTKHRDLIRMLLNKQDAFLTEDNHIDLFTDGNKLYEKVIEDIYNAKNYIHLEYYTFELDGLGHRILDALETKLKEGLEVKILYDDVGSKK